MSTTLDDLLSRNAQRQADRMTKDQQALRETYKAKNGYDPKELIEKPGFTLQGAAKMFREQFKLSESVTESQVYSLMTFLTADQMATIYKTVPTVYQELADIFDVKSNEVNVTVLQGGDVPGPVSETEELPEARLAGMNMRMKCYTFGKIIAVSRLLEEDDQTGEISNWANSQARLMPYAEESWWVKTLFNAYQPQNIRGLGQNGIIPPMCIAGSALAGYGGPAIAAGGITQASFEAAYEAMNYVTDVSGNLSLVDYNTIFTAAGADAINAEKILGSMYNTTAPGAAGGNLQGAFMKNVMEGKLTLKSSRFVRFARPGLDGINNPWGIGMAGRIGSFANRTPITVETEPNAGKSFDGRLTRMQYYRRFGAAVRYPEAFLAMN